MTKSDFFYKIEEVDTFFITIDINDYWITLKATKIDILRIMNCYDSDQKMNIEISKIDGNLITANIFLNKN